MSPARRFLVVGLAVGAVEALLGVLALRTGLAPYLFVCAAASVGLALAAHRLLVPRRDRPDDGRGGGDGPPPDDPPPPPWWPEFEASFRAYVHERDRPRARS